ncbi:MAG: hypothetical protein BWY71_01325 [Planctomycetes bacterium ADurb.Bin412]|nr:MAG: hypothetical protein BWY71_01325 [Planctomycetes bacterium ADurb.Bin412]
MKPADLLVQITYQLALLHIAIHKIVPVIHIMQAGRYKPVPAAVQHDHPRIIQRTHQRQRINGMFQHRPLERLVQQPPHHDRRIIPVPQNRPAHRFIEPRLHIVRIVQQPGTGMLRIHQQPHLIAEPHLAAVPVGPENPDHIHVHNLALQNGCPDHGRIMRKPLAHWETVAVVRTFQKYPFAVEPEITIFKPKVPESKPRGKGIKRIGIISPDTNFEIIQIGIIHMPKPGILDLQGSLEYPAVTVDFLYFRIIGNRFRKIVRRYHILNRQILGFFPGIHYGCFDSQLTGFGIGPDIYIGNINRRYDQQFHRIQNPALIWPVARRHRNRVVTVRRLIQRNLFDHIIRRIQHPHRQPIFLTRPNRIGYVKHKYRFAALVLTNLDIVQPDIRFVIHRPELQYIPAMLMRILWGLKFLPVPRQAVIPRKGILDDPGNSRLFRPRLN